MYLHVLYTEILHVFTCDMYRDPTCIYMYYIQIEILHVFTCIIYRDLTCIYMYYVLCKGSYIMIY